MIEKSIRVLCYSGLLVSLTATSLATGSYMLFNREIRFQELLIVLLGTFSIYNIDHIRGLKSDIDIDRARVHFIKKNKNKLVIATIVSLVICGMLGVTYISGIQFILLFPVLVTGLLHRRLKMNFLLSSLYITTSWIVVVILFPLSASFPTGIHWYILITGLALFANAYTYTGLDSSYAGNTGTTLPISALILSIIICLISQNRFLPLISVPSLTLVSVIFLRNKKQFKYLYLDGSLLAGSALFLMTAQLW